MAWGSQSRDTSGIMVGLQMLVEIMLYINYRGYDLQIWYMMLETDLNQVNGEI